MPSYKTQPYASLSSGGSAYERRPLWLWPRVTPRIPGDLGPVDRQPPGREDVLTPARAPPDILLGYYPRMKLSQLSLVRRLRREGNTRGSILAILGRTRDTPIPSREDLGRSTGTSSPSRDPRESRGYSSTPRRPKQTLRPRQTLGAQEAPKPLERQRGRESSRSRVMKRPRLASPRSRVLEVRRSLMERSLEAVIMEAKMELRREKMDTPVRGQNASYQRRKLASPVGNTSTLEDASYPRGRLASPLEEACYPMRKLASPLEEASYPRRKLASPLDEACYEEIDVNCNLTGGSGSHLYQNTLAEDSTGYVDIQQAAAEEEAEVYENITFHHQSYEVMELGGRADPYVVMSPLRGHRLVTAV